MNAVQTQDLDPVSKFVQTPLDPLVAAAIVATYQLGIAALVCTQKLLVFIMSVLGCLMPLQKIIHEKMQTLFTFCTNICRPEYRYEFSQLQENL